MEILNVRIPHEIRASLQFEEEKRLSAFESTALRYFSKEERNDLVLSKYSPTERGMKIVDLLNELCEIPEKLEKEILQLYS